ncbi:MAG TPA: tetratricopeptide repeat protein [Gemmatimonadales bacterium]|nr:tetratricopeptide repeat protein [Gemmatimonadales bacterium]
MNFEKLKETARKYEQKEEWRRAIEVYLQAIREFEAGNDPVPDLSVYNRIGDLYLKANEPGPAVQAYERAADLYGEQGFYNNAIALCGKILRVNPGRIGTYLKLAHLHARKNVVIEAKKNLLEYLERMNALNQLDEAFKSVKEFADQFPGNKEIRLMLSELLRASSRNAEAREQLEKLANDLEARGDTVGARKTLARLQALDAEDGGAPPPEGGAPRQAPPPKSKGDLVFLDTGAEFAPPPPRAPSGPASRKTRAVVVPPPGRPTEKVRSPGGLPLIEVGEEKAHAGPKTGETPAIPEPAQPPLEIEHSSLVDTPLELESVQPISDEAHLEAAASAEVAKTLGFEPTVQDDFDTGSVRPMEGLELDAPAPDSVELQVSMEGLELERASVDPAELEPGDRTSLIIPEPLESSPELAEAFDHLTDGMDAALPAPEVGGDLELLETGASETEFLLEPELEYAAEPLPAIDESTEGGEVTFLEPSVPVELTITDLEDRVLEDPDDPEAHRALGEALLAAGEQLRGQEELELALAGYEGREDWIHAGDLINELIRLDPNGVRYHQKRVEIGFRSGDRGRLIDAYLALADALLRVGAMDKALAVYRRVSEHDPGNQRALAALDAFASPEDELPPIPPPLPATPEPGITQVADDADHAVDAMFDAPAEAEPAARKRKSQPAIPPAEAPRRKSAPAARAPEPTGDFIDLGALVLDDDKIKDTRMRVEDEEPTGDEQKDFNEMLTAFRRGIDENIDAEDFQAHYDLGVAFKEMGLLDEAIAEFQKALRSPEGRLKTSEALGTAFFEKGQFAIAEAILKRAVESLGATDDEQIGLIYWLGRSQEAQGKTDASIANYQRVLAVDIGFQDVTARMNRLASGRAQ